MDKFWTLCLLLACLAAAMLGYAIGGQVETHRGLEGLRTPEKVTDWESIKDAGTIEAQGTYGSYEEYEQSVTERIYDR